MALGNGTMEGNEKTFINLKLVSSVGPTDDRPMFVVIGNDFKETDEKYSQVEGKIIKIKATHTPAKGKMGDIYGFKAFLEDGDEIYVIESTITNASKDLLNSLLPNIGKQVKISLYLNKHKYPASSTRMSVTGDFAETALEFDERDMKELFDLTAKQEKEQEVEKAKENNNSDEEISVEDIPF